MGAVLPLIINQAIQLGAVQPFLNKRDQAILDGSRITIFYLNF